MVRPLLLLALILVPATVSAQGALDPDSTAAPDSGPGVVHRIEVTRNDIFDPTERHWLARLANGLHIMTRAPVVRRELLFHVGQPYDSATVAETERNLRSLGVFRRVQIDTAATDSGLVVNVITKDGWSTKPDWRFRSTGGEVAFTIGVIEDNLLGTASTVALRYQKNPDRSSVVLGFRRPRLFYHKIGVAMQYEDRSDGKLAAAAVEQPFFSLSSRSGFRVDAEDRDERVLRFRGGDPVPAEALQRRFSILRVSAAWALRASSEGFLRLGATAQVRRDDYLPRPVVEPFPRTVTGAFGPYIGWNSAKFIVTRGVNGFGREEDIDLGVTVRLGAMIAPAAFGYERGGIGPQFGARYGNRLPSGFYYLDAFANALYTAAGLDSGSVEVSGTVVLQPGDRHVAVFRLEQGWQRNPQPGAEFDLGLGVGPRAYESHAFTGDRMFFGTAEYRYTVADDLWGLMGIGMAAFVDYGGAWYAGEPRRTGWDTGIGLRIGASRASETESLRFDLARRFATDVHEAGWVLVVGKGFPFGALGRKPM